ncbi:ABC transporter substrate-binding protein [Terrabacter terrigena]|uniref:ABC transporter substrate-binding protein n=1 Tax=Terrabacter terrigena TaxID=574718 RepID=A0ABW3MT94_9MICO
MNLKTKLCATGVTLATTAALGLVPAAAASAAPSAVPAAAPAAATPRATAAPIPLTFPTALGTFNGVFTPSGFTNQNGSLALTGVVTGTVTSATGAVTQVPAQSITTSVISAATTGSCQILDLVLGPLDLNVLGLVVHLDRVHLNITAQRGPGNLLGNLLCAVAGLLDGNGINGLATLLNRLLGL